MINKLLFLALSIILLASCKKNDPDSPIESVKFSKIESTFTPYQDKQLVPSKSFLFSSQSFNNNGNLTLSIYRSLVYSSFDTTNNPLMTVSYKYESDRLIEKNMLIPGHSIFEVNDKTLFTYTSKGDTAEIKRYDNKTNELIGRSGYTYGTNGKPSRITQYRISDDGDEHPAGSEYYSVFLKYDNNKNIIERSLIVPNVQNPANSIVQYSYNTKNDLIKAVNVTNTNASDIKIPFYEGQYTYNEKGQITEYIRTENTYASPNFHHTIYRFVNSYNDNDLLSTQTVYINSIEMGIIEYTYTK